MNDSMVILLAGMKVKEKLDENGMFEKIQTAKATGDEDEVLNLVRQSEGLTIEAIEGITKDDEVLTADELADKARMKISLINHNYSYFGFEEPYKEAKHGTDEAILTTYEEIKMRNGLADVEQQAPKSAADETEDVFIYDSHDKK